MKEKLKVGVLLTDEFVSAWEYKIIAETVSSDIASIDLIIRADKVSLTPPVKKKICVKHSYLFT